MSNLLNIGASGLLAQNHQLNAIGNNIANSDTTGYKAGHVTFAESFYNVMGREAIGTLDQRGQGVQAAGLEADWSEGASEETGIGTHIAIGGAGFLPVQSGGDTMFTRNGAFAWADYSMLSSGTGSGYVLALPSGAMLLDINQDLIRFDAIPSSMQIGGDGAIEVADASIVEGSQQLGLQLFSNPDALTRHQGGLYSADSAAASALSPTLVQPGSGAGGALRQGHLEMSNVDLVTEFTSLISAQRAFQANSRTISTADELLQEIMSLKR